VKRWHWRHTGRSHLEGFAKNSTNLLSAHLESLYFMAAPIKRNFKEFTVAAHIPRLLTATLLALYDMPPSLRPTSNDTIRDWFWQAWGTTHAHPSPTASPTQLAEEITFTKAEVTKRRREFRLGLFRLGPPRTATADLPPVSVSDATTVSFNGSLALLLLVTLFQPSFCLSFSEGVMENFTEMRNGGYSWNDTDCAGPKPYYDDHLCLPVTDLSMSPGQAPVACCSPHQDVAPTAKFPSAPSGPHLRM
jgi:hypothetical protein